MSAQVIYVDPIQPDALEAWLTTLSDPAPVRVHIVVDGDDGFGVWEFADGSTVTGRYLDAQFIREWARDAEARRGGL